MTLIALVGLITLGALASGQQQGYANYDIQEQAVGPSPAGSSRAAAAAAARPAPVAIIKQINRHNDDGSYTYGYEGADGSFKIETKLPTGEVTGKYGYVDDTGKLRVVDYGANRYGFQPAGEGITVAPPTLVDETTDRNRENSFAEYDEEGTLYARAPGQPQAQPQPTAAPAPAPAPRPHGRSRPPQARPVQYAPQPQYVTYEPAPRAAAPAPAPAPAPIPIPQVQQIPQQIPPQYQQQTFITYESQPRAAPRAPSPGRISISGPISSGPLFRPNALPAPIAAPVPAPVAQPRPAPVAAPPRPAPVREQPLRAAAPSGSVLDQLIQQFALPQGVGQPLHDISFGSYAG